MTDDRYIEFLRSKIPQAEQCGFEPPSAPHASLFPHQRDIATWACRGGRRAVFANFGLGKTRIDLQIASWVVEHTGGKFLIIAPLGVRQEFTQSDGPAMGIAIEYCTSTADVLASSAKIFITNYERVRDGGIDLDLFAGVAMDEASVLRSFGSKNYQEALRWGRKVRFRFVFTATPSPNRYKELIHYAAFLGVMDSGEALTRFFQRDSEEAGNLTLYPHMEKAFWAWISSWAVFIQKPSDLGYSDEGYDLPELQVHWHRVAVDHTKAWGKADSWGQHQLFMDEAAGLAQSAKVKRESIGLRIERAVEIMTRHEPERHWLLWHDLEAERDAIEGEFPRAQYGHWLEYRDGNARALALYERHYSAHKYKDGRERKLFCGPGEKTVLMTRDASALFVWRKFKDDSGQTGVNCAVFRNEGETLSSELILEAMAIGWRRWPGERFYTYVDKSKISSTNPGSCFMHAGWRVCGRTKGGLVVLECLPGAAVPQVAPIPCLETVYGSQDLEAREDKIMGFSRGEFRILATKPSIAGSGCNFQRHCADAIFLGVGYKFNDFVQAIHRIHRFQQGRTVNIHIVYLESEDAVVASLQAKWSRHNQLMATMSEILRQTKLTNLSVMELTRTLGCDRAEVKSKLFTAIRNDTVLETRTMPADSVDLILTSIPFGNQYEYSPSYSDFGHNHDNQAFFRQMDFLCPELLRVLRPGRIAAIHVKDRIRFGNVTGDGFPTVDPFSDDTVAAFKKAGFRFIARITIDTDVVRENNQTYRLGWSENAKDSSKMGAGMPEYVLVFRKLPSDTSDGYADLPVTKPKADYTRADWQIDAAGVWRSNGNRLPDPDILRGMSHPEIIALWKRRCLAGIYSHEEHVAVAKALEAVGHLPSVFMLFAPISRHQDVWSDISRMVTLNTKQSLEGREKHVCPLQLDIIKRLITRYTNPGEIVFDPFMGIGSTGYQAIKMGRRALGTELCLEYWKDSVGYLEMAEREFDVPTLFDLAAEGILQIEPASSAA